VEPFDASIIFLIGSAADNCNKALVELVRKCFKLGVKDDLKLMPELWSRITFALDTKTVERLESQLQTAEGSINLAITMLNNLDGTRMFEILDRIEGSLRKSSTHNEEISSSSRSLPKLSTSHVANNERNDSGVDVEYDTLLGGSEFAIATSPASSDLSSASVRPEDLDHLEDFEDNLRAIIDKFDKHNFRNMPSEGAWNITNTPEHPGSINLVELDRDTTPRKNSEHNLELPNHAQGCSRSSYEVLLDSGRDIDEKDEEGYTAMMRAAGCKCGNMCFPCLGPMRLLIDRGADLNVAVDGKTALHLAVRRNNYEAATLLIAKGADIEASSPRTPLYLAVRHNRPAMVEALIKAGANVNIVDDRNWSLIQHAVDRNRADALVELIETAKATGSNVDIDKAM
jgi:ankyrin repeat protein